MVCGFAGSRACLNVSARYVYYVLCIARKQTEVSAHMNAFLFPSLNCSEPKARHLRVSHVDQTQGSSRVLSFPLEREKNRKEKEKKHTHIHARTHAHTHARTLARTRQSPPYPHPSPTKQNKLAAIRESPIMSIPAARLSTVNQTLVSRFSVHHARFTTHYGTKRLGSICCSNHFDRWGWGGVGGWGGGVIEYWQETRKLGR